MRAHPVWRRHERRRRRHGPTGATGPVLTVGPGRHGRPAGSRRDERPGHLRRRHDRPGPGGRARAARADARPLSRSRSSASTVGGWVVTRSAGQQSTRLRPDRGAVRRRPHRDAPWAARPADLSRHPPPARTCARSSWARRAASGILTDVNGPGRPPPPGRARSRPRLVPRLGPRRCSSRGDSPGRRLPLSMIRVSTPLETATTLRPGRRRPRARPLRRYLGVRGMGPERCLAIVGSPASGRAWSARGQGRGRPRPRDRRASRRLASVGLAPRPLPRAGPARRAVGCGYARRHARDGDRLDDACPTSPRRSGGRSATGWRPSTNGSTPSATCRTSIRAARACTRPTCSGSPTDPDETLDRWRTLKTAASRVDRRPRRRPSATSTASAPITRPYLAAEKGALGMDADRRGRPDASTRTGRMARGVPARGRARR